MGGHTPTRVGRLVGEAEAVAAGAIGGSCPHKQQEAVVGVAAAGRCIAGAGSKMRVLSVDRSSVPFLDQINKVITIFFIDKIS